MRLIAAWAAIVAVCVVVTSIYGGYHYFSPIPYLDQWDGYVGFYRSLRGGRYSAFWSQHMEHRIIFSRILFLLDIVVFGGWNVFTVVMNYLLLLATGVVIFREYWRGKSADQSTWLVGGLIFGFLFAWCQNENLKWGFQSQGIAVYLFAFAAFSAYSRPEHSRRRLTLAILFSLLAVVSMGNGIATFVMLLGQGIFLRRSWKELVAIAVAGVIISVAYFSNYSRPIIPVQPLVAHITLVRPKYFAIFLGNPFYCVFQNLRLCAAAGLCFLIFAGLLIGRLYFLRRVTPYRAFLAGIIGMVVVAAAGAANGRWMAGLEFAVSSRYTTPMLMGYAALSLLALDVAKTRSARVVAALVPVIALTAIASFQPNSYAVASYLYDWKLAVLSRKIGIEHPEFESTIYPLAGHDQFARNADFAAADNIGPYGRGWLHDAGIAKFSPALVDTGLCEGYIESQSVDAEGLVAYGWAVAHESSVLIVLVDASGQTSGYGVTGETRSDVKKSVHGAPGDSGWIGFAKKGGTQPLRAYAYVDGKFCPLATISH